MTKAHHNPVVSAVMAVYNGEKYLAETIESVLSQDFQDFEFLIIDDGSEDGSKAILSEYGEKDSRIRLISRENRGLTKSLNEGIAMAGGEFIARMDSDDVCHQDRFSKQVHYLKTHPEVVALGGLVRYINASGTPLFVRKLPLNHAEIEQCHFSEWGGFLVHPSVMMRRSALQAVGGYDESFAKAQDYDLWFRLSTIGKLANLPEVILDYRYHPGAITQGSQPEQNSCRARILERELKRQGLASPLPLAFDYQVHISNPEWLLSAASLSGCVRTTFRCGPRVFLKHWRNIFRSFYFMGRVFYQKRPAHLNNFAN